MVFSVAYSADFMSISCIKTQLLTFNCIFFGKKRVRIKSVRVNLVNAFPLKWKSGSVCKYACA